jgi:phosphoserine phosphatase
MQRKLLILDLDHTLIYPSETEFAEAEFIIGPTYDRT